MTNYNKIPFITGLIILLAIGYYGCYRIGYYQGERDISQGFAEYVRETSKTLDEVAKLIKDTNDFLDHLNNYECRPKNETFPSQSYPREKIRG